MQTDRTRQGTGLTPASRRMSHRGIVTLVSGGLDSLLLVQALRTQGAVVFPLYVRCGLVWESVELLWLKRWLAALRQAHLKALKMTEAPMRSLYGHHWSLKGRRVPSSKSPDAAV